MNASSNIAKSSVAGSSEAVVVQCHGVACALPIRFVSRLVLPEQVETSEGSSLVYVAGRSTPHMAWDLGERLGMSRVDAAWVLLELPHRGDTLSMALRTGTCLTIDSLPPPIPLPPSLFAHRAHAIAGLFHTNAKHGGATFGIVVDVEHLWSPSELVATRTMLRGPRE